MKGHYHRNISGEEQDRFFTVLERLLAIEATGLSTALNQATQVVGEALHAAKVEVLLHDPASGALPVPEAHRRRGRALRIAQPLPPDQGHFADVSRTGVSCVIEQTRETAQEFITPINPDGQCSRSVMVAVIEEAGVRWGVLVATPKGSQCFSESDLYFLQAAARWVGMVLRRAKQVEQVIGKEIEQRKRAAIIQLLTTVVHDLRNYLTPLRGHLDLMECRARREGREQDMQGALLASRALLRFERLVRGLMDVLHLEEGTFTITSCPLSVAELFRKTISVFQTEETKIDLQVSQEARVCADPERLRQLLEILIMYMVKRVPKGTLIEVSVNTEQQADGEWMIVTVSNQGLAVPADLLPHLLLPSVAGFSSMEEGLGLYLAHHITAAHQGRLAVDSLRGKGVRFSLSLPVRKERAKVSLVSALKAS